jgi:biotin synthase
MKLNTNEIIDLYENSTIEVLVKKAGEVCFSKYGYKVFLRGLIEFSNYCNRDCLYCGIRNSNKKINRYRLTEEEILFTIRNGFISGLKTFVLQSGEDDYFTVDKLCALVKKVKSVTNNEVALTLSCGIMTRDQFKELKNAGCDRYLLRFETSDENLHSYLRNGISLRRRLQALTDLKELGYEVGSGFMVGLPGETEQIRINNALLCKEFGFDMIGIGPFIPHQDTPLRSSKQMSLELAVKSVALIRLLLPDANIPATTAAGSLESDGREKMLSAGANVLMPNITPSKYKKNYLLYPGKICLDEDGIQCMSCLSERVRNTSKMICYERGDSLSFSKRNI